MRVFDGAVFVDYGQAYFESGSEDQPELENNFTGFANGMCGTAVDGWVWCNTATYAGNVRFVVEVLDAPPPIDDSYDDVVEASFTPFEQEVSFSGLMGEPAATFTLEAGAYRVRYSGRNADAAEQQNASGELPEIALDEYLVQLWPAPTSPDEIVRQTSTWALQCHQTWGSAKPPSGNDIWTALQGIPLLLMEEITLYATEQFLPIVGIDQDPLVSRIMADASRAIRDHVGLVPAPHYVSEKVFEVNDRVSQIHPKVLAGSAAMDEIHGWVLLQEFLSWCAKRKRYPSEIAINPILGRIHGWSHGEWPRIEAHIRELLERKS